MGWRTGKGPAHTTTRWSKKGGMNIDNENERRSGRERALSKLLGSPSVRSEGAVDSSAALLRTLVSSSSSSSSSIDLAKFTLY